MSDESKKSEEAGPAAVIPILGYAEPSTNLRDTAFSVEQHPDGVTITKALPAEPYMAVALVIVGSMAAVAAIAAATAMFSNRGGDVYRSIGIIVLLAIAAVLFNAIRFTRARTLSISLRAGELIVINPRGHLRRIWVVPSPRAFTVSIGAPSLLNGKLIAQLRVVNGFGIARVILAETPKAECLWLAGVLNGNLRG